MGRITFPYSLYLLTQGKYFFMHKNKQLLQHLSSYLSCDAAENCQTWLDNAWSMAGSDIASRDDYYLRCNPMHVVPFIKQPTLILNAYDDPLCTVDNVIEHLHLFDKSVVPGAALVLTQAGSHCAFFEIFLGNWAERVAFEFFESVLKT